MRYRDTSFQYHADRPKGRSHRDFFAEHLEDDEGEMLDLAAAHNVAYIAWRRPDGLVTARTIDFRWLMRDPYGDTFAWDDPRGEESGWPRNRCPQRILDLLSPVDELWPGPELHWTRQTARQWREHARGRLERRAAQPKVRPGDWVKFTQGWHLDVGYTYLMEFHAGSHFRLLGDRSGVYHLKNWRDRDFTIESARAHREAPPEDSALAALVS